MSLDNKVVDLADLKVSHDYLLGRDKLLSDRINELGSGIDGIQSQITALGNGSPIPVETVAEMTDNTKAYLYTGSEQGYTSGYWYTYDSTQAKFVPRGEYGAGVIIDSTLTVTGNAADAKATGDAIKAVKTFVVQVPGSAAVLSGSITAGDFAKALAAYTAGSGVYAVKDGEVYQLSAVSSSTMTFTQMYHGTMNFIKQIQITSADTFTVTNTALSSSATDTSYSNTASGLTATNVQAAIDENAAAISNTNGRLVDVETDLGNLSVDADMIDANDKKTEYIDYDGYTLQTSSYLDYDGIIGTDQTGLCATTGFIDISDVPDTLYVKFGSTVEGYTGRRAIVLKNTDNTCSSWIYSQLPTSFCTKVDGVVTVNVGYLKNQGTRSKIGFNLTATDHYVKYAEITPLTHKALDWLNVGYSQIKDTNPPENLYNKTCSAFGGSTVSGEIATITAVNQGIMTNPFVSNSNCVRVKAKITFTVPNVHVLLPYYANGSWNYGNILELDEIESGVEFTFDFDASNYIVYQSAERFRLIFQTRTESGVNDYSGTITITSLSIQSLDTMRQSEYFNENFEQMMSNVFSGIDVAKTLPTKTAEIYTTPNGDRVVFGVGENNVLVAIPVVPSKTLFFGNSLLLGMNTTSANHQYVYGMCATAPDKDYCHLVMNTVTGIKSSAIYDRVHGAQFESLGTSDSFSALWNTIANTYTGQPLKNSFTSDLDLIIIQISDNINTADKRTAFAANVDTLLRNIRNSSPNARLLWVYGWFSSADTNAIILSACQKWGIESLNIHPYNTPANQGVSGQSYIDGSGNTQTVSDAWITHPGDNGFSAIADAIIDKLGVD